MGKVHILKWLATGRIAKTAYYDKNTADITARNANERRSWAQKNLFAGNKWVVLSLDIR